MPENPGASLGRRAFLQYALTAAGAMSEDAAFASALLPQGAPAFVRSARPELPHGVASGDVTDNYAVIWSQSNRPARMFVEYATTSRFRDLRRAEGSAATEDTGFTARAELFGLPAGQHIFYRVWFQDLGDERAKSKPAWGYFRTAPLMPRDVVFVWSADCAGQGFGINQEWGGMRIFETMRRGQPDFFIHCGDTIYADGPIEPEVILADGSVWKNVTTEAKSHVAETLEDFRGCHAYNRLDRHVLAFSEQVPIIVQWDDHETCNNWYPHERLEDGRYREKEMDVLAARARQAFLEYYPMQVSLAQSGRIYRKIPYGPLLDVFMLDMRSYRGPNDANNQSAATAFLGAGQLDWLKRSLLESPSTWKVIGADMPLGLVVPDGKNRFEAVANADNGPPKGRELEITDLLRFIKQNSIRNVVWLTADVHYTAAHHFHPDRARFKDFLPFWEFVSGPLNAGTFGPSELDGTFGPEVVFMKTPPQGQSNLPPSDGLQFFGEVRIEGQSGVMTVRLKDVSGAALYEVSLPPEA